MPFAQEKMGFSRPPKLFLRQDSQNAANPMGKTGFYDPQNESITLYITDRHPKDIMRSLAHELQHHTQKCNGDFESVQNMGEEGYAQADPHMRSMEIEAYQASIVFRDWEDSTKGTIYYEHLQKGDNSSMSTKDWKNGEINTLLNEKWGFTFKVDELGLLKEATDPCQAASQAKHQYDGAAGAERDALYHAWQSAKSECEKQGVKTEDTETIEEECAATHDDEDVLEEEELEERRARGRKGPHIRGPEDPRLRESVAKMHKAGYSKKQIKEFLTKAYNKALRS